MLVTFAAKVRDIIFISEPETNLFNFLDSSDN